MRTEWLLVPIFLVIMWWGLMDGKPPQTSGFVAVHKPLQEAVHKEVDAGLVAAAAVLQTRGAEIAAGPKVAVKADSKEYLYVGPPTISRDVYVSVICEHAGPESAVCAQAPEIYGTVVAGGIDPAIELAHMCSESGCGSTGLAPAPWHNLHGVHCDGIGECVDNGVPGDLYVAQYSSYSQGVAAWVRLIKDSGMYYPSRNTPEQVVEIYCECSANPTKAEYVEHMKQFIDGWRSRSGS